MFVKLMVECRIESHILTNLSLVTMAFGKDVVLHLWYHKIDIWRQVSFKSMTEAHKSITVCTEVVCKNTVLKNLKQLYENIRNEEDLLV